MLEESHVSVERVSIEIEAPPADVFAVLRDIESWPEWNAAMTSLKRMDEGPLGAGSRALVQQPGLPPTVWQVTSFVEGSRFTWVTTSPGVRTEGDHVVDPAGAGSRLTLSLRFCGLLGPLARLIYGNLTRRYMSLEAQGLKARCESRATA
jgi:uncharacterized membrane protein